MTTADMFRKTIRFNGFTVLVNIVLLLLVFVILNICACRPRQAVPCIFPDDLCYSAALDSIGIVDFHQLSTTQQKTRRREALGWLSRSRHMSSTDAEIRALRNSLGLAPDQPDIWLELAELTRWTGDYQDEQTYLSNARLSVPSVQRDRQPGLYNKIAQSYSWHFYRRGQWRMGLAWSDSSMAVNSEDKSTLLIRGLLLANYGQIRYAEDVAREISRRDVFDPGIDWVRGMNDWGQGWYEEASYSLTGIRPNEYRRTECLQDIGMIAEHLGYWSEARIRYQQAADALPFSDLSCLTKHTHHILASPSEQSQMPIWLAFDRYFVVGSLSAYTVVANRHFEDASTVNDRKFWAEATIDAASICIRKQIDVNWALAVRGIVFAKLERYTLAIQDLQRVVDGFAGNQYEYALSLAWLGHALLIEDDYTAALPYLQRAVVADPQAAVAWSDLGLALIKSAEMTSAFQALNTAISLDPQLAVAWYNRGLMHYHNKRWPEAIADLEQALLLAPGNSALQQILQRAIMREQRAPVSKEPDDG